ncbi:MAG: NAD(P)-dependent alcohol dehydrogenase [Acidobacteriota bacterium]
MQAITYSHYGAPDILQLEEVARPVLGEDAVLVKVRAAAANPYDWHFMRGEPYFMRLFIGLRRPKAKHLGVDFAGEVEAVGENVTSLRPGDEVFGVANGAFAEVVRAAETELARKPSNLTFEQAAAVPLAALTALQGLRDAGRLQPKEKVLIIGASGGVGTFAVQIAKALGAHVTGVCSTRNLELVRSLGADEVIDYTQEDCIGSDQKYDLIFQLAGTRSPAACRRALTPNGRLILSSGDSSGRWIGPLGRLLQAAVLSPFVSQKLAALDTKRNRGDLRDLRQLIEAGQVTPVIDRIHTLAEVPEALRYLEQGHARGKVVIKV